MRRLVNQITFSIIGISISVFVAWLIGADARWGIAFGALAGALAYFFVATIVIRRSDFKLIRGELERTGYKLEDESEEGEPGSPGLLSPLYKLMNNAFVASKANVHVMPTDAANDVRDRSLHIWIEVPDAWPDFTIGPAQSVMERPMLGLKATNSGFAHPDFDSLFRLETGDLYEIEKHLNRSVQERLLVLPPRSQITCDAGVLTIETGPILPLDTAKVVQACESIADQSAPKPGVRG